MKQNMKKEEFQTKIKDETKHKERRVSNKNKT